MAAPARKPRTQAAAKTAGKPAVVVRPTTANEIVRIFQNRQRFPSPVRPMGSGSSITRAVSAIGGTVVDMTAMNRVIDVGKDTVTVQPGIALSDLADELREHGKELVGGFDLANRTVGGAICGAGLEATIAGGVSQFAGHAVRLKVIGPTGRKFLVTEKTRSLLHLMRLSYGLLGVVYEVTLRTRPISGFTSQTAKVSFRDFKQLGPRLTAAGAGVKLFLFPFADHIFFELRRPSDEPTDGRRGYSGTVRDWALYSALPVVAKSLARAVPFKALRYPLLDNIGSATQSLMTGERSRTSSNAAEQTGRHRALGSQRFTYCTWAFPAADFPHVVAGYKLFCKTHYAKSGFRCDLPTLSYRLNRDRSAMLSPSFDGPLMTLSPLCSDTKGLDEFMFEFADFAATQNGVPFLNQTPNATPECVSARYGDRFTMFSKVRRQMDPENRLLNQFFANYFK